jgi:hypothetical protein
MEDTMCFCFTKVDVAAMSVVNAKEIKKENLSLVEKCSEASLVALNHGDGIRSTYYGVVMGLGHGANIYDIKPIDLEEKVFFKWELPYRLTVFFDQASHDSDYPYVIMNDDNKVKIQARLSSKKGPINVKV